LHAQQNCEANGLHDAVLRNCAPFVHDAVLRSDLAYLITDYAISVIGPCECGVGGLFTAFYTEANRKVMRYSDQVEVNLISRECESCSIEVNRGSGWMFASNLRHAKCDECGRNFCCGGCWCGDVQGKHLCAFCVADEYDKHNHGLLSDIRIDIDGIMSAALSVIENTEYL
jgi:hypothetical protein